MVIAGPDGLRRPSSTPAVGIEFNGDATSDLAGDTFTVTAPCSPTPPPPRRGCVGPVPNRTTWPAALLLRCVQLVPDVFALDSDEAGTPLGHRPSAGIRPDRLAAQPGRDAVRPVPEHQPFTDITQLLTHHR